MLTSAQIRQQFLDFFREKQHTIVPSSSLMPDSPNLLFTNAGMNQFVPIFLGETRCPYTPGRAADTQKCIRAGGKHNDLDDVGLDTYHHTFFEMLGNWSFGDYFKKEAIGWAWELIVGRWKFPPQRVYATIYNPDKSIGDPAERDEEAWGFWAEKFRSAGLDPAVHIVHGNKKDNFWMMGETGPCGPCSELHIDLTPAGDTRGSLVNAGDARCIEIWNLVFIQFNANPDGTFTPLPAQHVDTGMGFERVASIIQGTKEFTDFANARISNYDTDIFRPIFDELEKMSGQKYASTLPAGGAQAPGSAGILPVGEGVPASRTSPGVAGNSGAPAGAGAVESASPQDAATSAPEARAPRSSDPAQIAIDVAFRVIADHIRTLSFAIADGIQPGNTDRNYVLRRILRRAVRYGRTLGFREPFFYKLVAVLAREMGGIFPALRERQKHVEEVLKREEEAFNKTLDRGIALFELYAQGFDMAAGRCAMLEDEFLSHEKDDSEFINRFTAYERSKRLGQPSGWGLLTGFGRFEWAPRSMIELMAQLQESQSLKEASILVGKIVNGPRLITGDFAFKLYDTYGFPLDLTELMARERGLKVDTAGFEKHMEEQRARARAAQKKQVIELSEIETKEPTRFTGYDALSTPAQVLEVVSLKDQTAVILDASAAYAEMGGQVGDTGELTAGAQAWRFTSTQKSGATWLHFLDGSDGKDGKDKSHASHDSPAIGSTVTLTVDAARRNAIQRHHTVTHLLHWALHEVVSREATQKGSFVGPDKLTFDFNSAALTPAQVRDIERLVNERIVENAAVQWNEVAYADVKGRADIMQFFGDKYGETVRLVDIGGFSKELCAGTHTRATGEIGLFRIVSEAAIAAGVRRIEAVAGLTAYDSAVHDAQRLHALALKIGAPLADVEKKLDALLSHEKELEKALKSAQQREAAGRAKDLLAKAETIGGIPAIIANLGHADGDTLQTVADALKGHFAGVVVLGGSTGPSVALVASVSSDYTARVQAGKIISAIAPLVGGKGGGKPNNARGGGKDPAQLDAALAHARTLLGAG